MKYYHEEHVLRYRKFSEVDREAWSKVCDNEHFEDFSSRAFLEAALPRLRLSVPFPAVLEYGCGIGQEACFMAKRGFRVDGMDLMPIAIEVARQFARDRGLDIHYEVQDICELPHKGKKYDVIVDSYCLQGIVTDSDRAKVFSAVQARLKTGGHYLISTAMFDEDRFSEEQILDAETSIIYNKYGEEGLINAQTSIVYERLAGNPDNYEEAIKIQDIWYLPNRRHLKPPALIAELEAAGFVILYQEAEYGENVICL